MYDDYFKLYPPNPDTETKLSIVKERPERQSIPINVESWKRIMGNKSSVLLDNKDIVNYQCTALDANSCIQVKINYKVNGRYFNKVLMSDPVQLCRELRQRLLYEPQPVKASVLVQNFKLITSVSVLNRKIRFTADFQKYQLPVNENTIQLDPNPAIMKVLLQNYRDQFLKFYSDCLRMNVRARTNVVIIIFNKKIQRDTIAAQIVNSSQDFRPLSSNQITIVGSSTPRNDPSIKHDHSASSLTSANKSRHKDKKKVKISQRLNLKKSYSKATPSKLDNSSRQCLNIFEEDGDFGDQNNNRESDNMIGDTSMDLRGSFEEFQSQAPGKNEDDALSDASFKQKKGNFLNPIDQENKKLREENQRLKKQLEMLRNADKELNTLKKKYTAVVEENNRLQNQRRAIIKDKVKFQSSYHKQVQEKQALKRELQSMRGMGTYRRP